jgi:hypothetical protein
MKTIPIIIATVFTFQATLLFSDNNETRSTINDYSIVCTGSICILAPVTPTEATFEDDAPLTEVAGLAHVTPTEADISHVVPEANMDIYTLAPVTPTEADFNNSVEDQVVAFSTLAPVTPAEADFE